MRPITPNGETIITVRVGEHEAVGIAEVRAEREIAPIEPPSDLQFERLNYRLKIGQPTDLLLEAPLELIDQYGSQVTANSSSTGIVILGGAVGFRFDEDLAYCVAKVRVDPRQLEATGKITAQLGDQSATCRVAVRVEAGGPDIRIQVQDREAGPFRAIFNPNSTPPEINIMGRHPVMRRYLGDRTEGSAEEFSEPARAAIAEIVAAEAARLVVERKYPTGGADARPLDATSFYNDHRQYLDKYVRRAHQILIPK